MTMIMLEKNQQTETEIVYIEVAIMYRYKCKRCKRIYNEFDTYIKHANQSKHMGIILQVITHDELVELS
jgi:phage FluMu protein Com